MAYNLAALRQYARDLTGVYSTDLVSDGLLTNWINEAYLELDRSQNWPWDTGTPVDPLVLPTDTPIFRGDFHQYLSYRAAVKVLSFEADDTQRTAQYTAEADALYEQLVLEYLFGTAYMTAGPSFNTPAMLVAQVRDQLGVHTDIISYQFIVAKIMDAYNELYESQTWPFAKNPFPGMGWDYTRVLVFAAAGRLAIQAGRDEAFVSVMATEYSLALEEMKTVFLRNTTGILSGTRIQLRQLVRSITGDYSKIIPNIMIDMWLSEEYQLLSNEKDWNWLEQVSQIPLVANTSQFQLVNGTRNVLEMYLVENVAAGDGVNVAVAQSEIVYPVPHVLNIEKNSERFHYDVTFGGLVTISPAPMRDFVIRVRYVQTGAGLATDTSEPAFAQQFRSILAYRVAMRVAAYTNAPQNIMDLCSASASAMFDAMYTAYQLEHSMEPLQLGALALESHKYMPWFRTA